MRRKDIRVDICDETAGWGRDNYQTTITVTMPKVSDKERQRLNALLEKILIDAGFDPTHIPYM
jgi:hypothetical protein